MSAVVTIDERVRVPASALTHSGFREWAVSERLPEGMRVTFLDGEVIVDMSPEAGESHNKVKSCFTAVLSAFAQEHDLGEVYGDGMLLTNEAVGLSSEPDTTFVSWSRFESTRVRLADKARRADDTIELVGSPDVVVEVVSDSSVRKDLVLLREAYHRAEIPEYWIVDARGPMLSFEILVWHPEEFRAADPGDRPQRSGVFQRTFALSRAKNRVGRWTYRLDVSL